MTPARQNRNEGNGLSETGSMFKNKPEADAQRRRSQPFSLRLNHAHALGGMLRFDEDVVHEDA